MFSLNALSNAKSNHLLTAPVDPIPRITCNTVEAFSRRSRLKKKFVLIRHVTDFLHGHGAANLTRPAPLVSLCREHGASSNLRSFVERGLVFVESLPWFGITRSYEIKNRICYLLLELTVKNVRTIWERKNSGTFHRSHKISARTCIFPQDTVWSHSVLVICSSRCSEFLRFVEIGAVKGKVSVGKQTKFLKPTYTTFGWYSILKISMWCCWTLVSFMKISLGKDIIFLGE